MIVQTGENSLRESLNSSHPSSGEIPSVEVAEMGPGSNTDKNTEEEDTEDEETEDEDTEDESTEDEDTEDEDILDFDVNMLRQMASNSLNRRCVHSHRLTSGLYNEIHLLQFDDNGPDCIARLSRELIHPEEKLSSEVATMRYVAQNTSIKVPKVYYWDCSSQNPIKVPYILMEYIPGQHLYKIWNKLTDEKKKSTLSQMVDVLHELWTKCQFDKIGCIYASDQKKSDSSNSVPEKSLNSISDTQKSFTNFQIGPIVSPLFYIEKRNLISSSNGPFGSSQELFCALIQKERQFFITYGQEELIIKENVNRADAKNRVAKLTKQLDLLQSKLSKDNPFDDSIDRPPFSLIHGDFDAQNILVDDDAKIVGIIDWEFSRTGTLWDLCKYPIWIQEVEEPFKILNDEELQENREKQELRDYFRKEMITKLGDKSGQILDTSERDKRIRDLDAMLTLMVHYVASLENLIKCFFEDHCESNPT